MTAQDLAHPEWTNPVLAILLACAVALVLARARSGRRRGLLGPHRRPGVSILRDAALLLALTCIGVALLGPRLGETVIRVPASGVDVVLLLDVSRSMDATDVAPSRLARARHEAAGLLARLGPGDRAALAVFASSGVLLTPLTPDTTALTELLEAIDTTLVQPAGSDLAAGIRASVSAFEGGSERPRVLFLLSDGEDPERRPHLGIREALEAEVRVLAVSLGSPSGAQVPDHGLPLRSPNGEIVISRPRTDRLERIANATGGLLLPTDDFGAIDLALAAHEARRDTAAVAGNTVERRVRAVRVLPFAILALLLLLLETLPRARRRQLTAGAAAMGVLTLIGAGPGSSPEATPPAQVGLGAESTRDSGRVHDPIRLVELGIERLARGQQDAARRAFLAAALTARDPAVAALAYYDLGVVALETGDYEEARDAFFDALALAPRDREARYNLEWTLEAMPGEAPPPPDGPGGDESEEEQEREEPDPDVPALMELTEAEGAEPQRGDPAPLTEDERNRWLGRVEDDLEHALRSAATAAARERTSRTLAW